ncbi:ABC transporter substrate-binding protein [Salinifilum aidingensis]
MRRITAIGAALSAAVALGVTACGSTAREDRGQGWSFRDDRGVVVTAEDEPERVVAQTAAAGALKDFGVPVVGTFGPLVRDDGSTEPEAGSIDPDEVTDVTGAGYGEVNTERLAALDPDVVVSGKYPGYPGLWHLNEDQERQINRFAPTIGVQQAGLQLPEGIANYERTAEALGADVESPRVQRDEAAFHRAAERLRGIGQRLREQGRTILAIGGNRENFYAVNPPAHPDLAYYAEQLGLPLRVPDSPDGPDGYFESMSWENAGRYPADILMWDTRSESLTPEEMRRKPVFAQREEVRAGSLVEWDAVAPMSYASYAGIMNELADQLEAQLT